MFFEKVSPISRKARVSEGAALCPAVSFPNLLGLFKKSVAVDVVYEHDVRYGGQSRKARGRAQMGEFASDAVKFFSVQKSMFICEYVGRKQRVCTYRNPSHLLTLSPHTFAPI